MGTGLLAFVGVGVESMRTFMNQSATAGLLYFMNENIKKIMIKTHQMEF